MKYFTIDISDLNTFEELLKCIEPKNPVANSFLSDTEVIRDSSPDSPGENNSPSASSFLERNSKSIDTRSIVQTSSTSENFDYSANSKAPTLAAHRPPSLTILVAPAITPAHTSRPIHITVTSDIHPPFPLPPPLLTKTVAKTSKSFKHRKSIDATIY